MHEALPQHASSLLVHSDHFARHDIASELLLTQVPPQDPWQLSSFELQNVSTPQLYKFHEQQYSESESVGAGVGGERVVGAGVGGEAVVGAGVGGEAVVGAGVGGETVVGAGVGGEAVVGAGVVESLSRMIRAALAKSPFNVIVDNTCQLLG